MTCSVGVAGFLDEHAVELVPLVLHTLHTYAEKPDQRAVEKVLQAALASDAFLKPFTAALVKQEAAKLNKQVSLPSGVEEVLELASRWRKLSIVGALLTRFGRTS